MPRLPLLSLTLPIVLLMGGCDRQSGENSQPKETSVPATAAEVIAALHNSPNTILFILFLLWLSLSPQFLTLQTLLWNTGVITKLAITLDTRLLGCQ